MSHDLQEKIASHLSMARVRSVNPNTFTAVCYIFAGRGAGRAPECIIRHLQKNDLSHSGVIFLPDEGDEVYLDWSFGPTPVIMDHIPKVFAQEKDTAHRTTVTPVRSFGGEDKAYEDYGNRPYRFGPKDLMPGDKVLMGKFGNFIGILAGGLNILKAGALSQLIMCKAREMVKLIAGRFELISHFGSLKFKSENGVNSIELLGNGDLAKSNAHRDSDWDYEFKVGGSNLFEMNLMRDKFNFRVDPDGGFYVNSAKTGVITLKTPPIVNVQGSQQSNVDGDRSNFTTGDNNHVIRGTDKTKSKRRIYVCSGAVNEATGGPATYNYMRSKRETVRGTSITDITTIGYEKRIGAGDYNISIGNPIDLGTPSPLLLAQLKTGSFNVTTFSGDFNFFSLVKGDFNTFSLLGNVAMTTVAGNMSFNTAAGNVGMSTFLGNAALTTLAGNVDVTTLLGNVTVGTAVGNLNLQALAGKITMTAGAGSIELGPAGIKISHAGIDLIVQLQKLVNLLSTTVAAGNGAPLSTAPAFGAQLAEIALLKGV